MSKIQQKVNRIFSALCIVAFFTNIGLLIAASTILTGPRAFELEVLSLINMILLSFVLLREPNQETE